MAYFLGHLVNTRTIKYIKYILTVGQIIKDRRALRGVWDSGWPDLAWGFSDLKMTWILYCAGAVTGDLSIKTTPRCLRYIQCELWRGNTNILTPMQWRRLHGARGARAPPPLLQMARHGGTVSRRTANKKLIKLYCASRKSSPKRLIVF